LSDILLGLARPDSREQSYQGQDAGREAGAALDEHMTFSFAILPDKFGLRESLQDQCPPLPWKTGRAGKSTIPR
jgi:hypothetical protein